jgi:hypothetical protein
MSTFFCFFSDYFLADTGKFLPRPLFLPNLLGGTSDRWTEVNLIGDYWG